MSDDPQETCVQYDPIRHLAMALHFRRWREVHFVALTVYGDAGGSTHQTNEAAIVLAGFMGNAELSWCEFDKEWELFLEKHHLKCLHMNELSRDPAVRQPILDDAIRIITNPDYNLHRFLLVVDADDYKQYQRENKGGEFLLGPAVDAYLFAAMAHIEMIDSYCRTQRLVQPKEFIYEAGDAYQDDLEEAITSRGYPRPIFRDKTLKPLQASDFLASEILQGYRDGVLIDAQLGIRRRVKAAPSKYLLAFMKMQGGDPGIWTKDNLSKPKQIEEIVRRLQAIKNRAV